MKLNRRSLLAGLLGSTVATVLGTPKVPAKAGGYVMPAHHADELRSRWDKLNRGTRLRGTHHHTPGAVLMVAEDERSTEWRIPVLYNGRTRYLATYGA